jgi:hypothetical protein
VSQDDRIKRPRPERTGPIRGWSGIFGRPTGTAGNGHAPGFDDVVTRSVELGYRVIDEYVRQGQRAAAGMRAPRTDPEAMTSDLQGLMGRMAQYTSDFLGVWSEFVEVATRGAMMPGAMMPGAMSGAANGAANGSASGSATGHGPSPAPAASEDPGVRVELQATRPTEVSVDLRPLTPGARLCVQGMRAMEPGEPRLDDVTLAASGPGAPLVLRIVVPAAQPAGTYNGIVVEEETSRPVGTVSVRLPPV